MPDRPPSKPQDDIDEPTVGESLSSSADHTAGLHLTPHDDCWRCQASDEVIAESSP